MDVFFRFNEGGDSLGGDDVGDFSIEDVMGLFTAFLFRRSERSEVETESADGRNDLDSDIVPCERERLLKGTFATEILLSLIVLECLVAS